MSCSGAAPAGRVSKRQHNGATKRSSLSTSGPQLEPTSDRERALGGLSARHGWAEAPALESVDRGLVDLLASRSHDVYLDDRSGPIDVSSKHDLSFDASLDRAAWIG